LFCATNTVEIEIGFTPETLFEFKTDPLFIRPTMARYILDFGISYATAGHIISGLLPA
jgi:hypothetical protein